MASLKYLCCFLLIAAPTIQGSPASNAVLKSKVEISVSKLTIPLGQSRSVTCNPSGDPVPTIQWLKNGADLGNGTIQSGNTLSIFDAKVDDAGEYICLGLVGQKVVAQQKFEVEIDQTRPTVTVEARKLILSAGQSASVDCKPQGSPLPLVQWNKGKGRFSSRVSQSGSRLVISDAKHSDAGIYVCNAVVDGTSVWSDYLVLEITDAAPVTPVPSITTTVAAIKETEEPTTVAPEPETPKVTANVRTLRLVKGHSGAVDCIAEGSPLPTVQWSKEGGKFGKATRQDGNTLIISNAELSDEGNYVCIGLVGGTAVWSENVQVEVDGTSGNSVQVPAASSPRVDVNAASLKLVKGRSGAIDCNPGGTPTPKVQWSREYGNFDNSTRVVGNTLVISDAQNDDVGNYICNGIVESTVVWTDYAQVEIVEKDSSESDNYEVSIFEGHGSNIRCEMEFVPDDHRHTPEDKELVIRIASKKPSGYQCKVFGHSLVLREARLRLDVQSPEPPSVIVRPERQSAALGQAVFVECVVVKGEGVSVQWERVNGTLSSRVQARGSTLVFHHIASEDAGSYRCIAWNGGGEVSETAQINVINAPYERSSPHDPKVTILGSVQRTVRLQRGQSKYINCLPLGTPLPTVQWKKGAGDFREGITQEGTYLKITNATDADTGDYVCDALVEATPVWTDYLRVIVYDKCEQKADGGYVGSVNCSNKFKYIRWYYNPTYKGCYQFYYSGCGGNNNNFLTEAQCRRACDATRRN